MLRLQPSVSAAGILPVRGRLTVACVLLLIAGVTLDHRPLPRLAETLAGAAAALLALGLIPGSPPRTRVLYTAAALFGTALTLSSLQLPNGTMHRTLYLPALCLLALAVWLAWPELRTRITQDRDRIRTAAVENTRAHTARELHDETLQQLVHHHQSLTTAARSSDVEILQTALRDGAARTTEHAATLRDILADIHPTLLTELGLLPALEALLERHARRHPHTHFTFHIHTDQYANRTDRPDPDTELAAYRIAQEALSNAVKHSNADRIHADLTWTRRLLVIAVNDNGTGTGDARGGLGIPAMRARAALRNGDLTLHTTPGDGTTVTARLPIRTTRRWFAPPPADRAARRHAAPSIPTPRSAADHSATERNDDRPRSPLHPR